MGGIAEAYIANYSAVTKPTLTGDEITKITTSEKFKKYHFRKETSQFTSTLNKNVANGTSYVSTDIQLVFTRMETAKRLEIAALSLGELVVIVKDNNGKYWYFGYDEPVIASAGDAQSGTARADRNGYSITLQDNAATYPYEVAEAALSDIFE